MHKSMQRKDPRAKIEINLGNICASTSAYVWIFLLNPSLRFSFPIANTLLPSTPSRLSFAKMHPVASSEDLVPIIFGFLPPSVFVNCSLVSSLWEMSSHRHLFQHITALQCLNFSQGITLFSSGRELARHVRSCCFHYSIPAASYINDDISIFMHYIISTCKNLVALSFWDVPLDGIGFTLLPTVSALRVLTLQNCEWDYYVLQDLIHCCANIDLLQFCNLPLFTDDATYHCTNLPVWASLWSNRHFPSPKPTPTLILIQSSQQQFHNAFWQLLNNKIDTRGLKYLKLLPHTNDVHHAINFVSSALPSIKRLETTLIRKSNTSAYRSDSLQCFWQLLNNKIDTRGLK